MAAANLVGTTTQDQINAQNGAATATANQSVMGTQQAPALSATSQPGIIAGAMSATAQPKDYSSQLQDLYKTDLSRAADSSGLDFYGKQLQSGMSIQDVDNEIHSSPEYQSLHSQQTSYQPALLGDPAKWNITADQTVQGQMKTLIDPNNPYYQQWATAGAQDAAARGFTGNSSIRSSGILDSVMRGATPIATSDAGTYAKAAGYNADQLNQFAIANQNAQNSAGQFNSNLGTSAKNAQLSSDTQKYVANQSADTQKAIAQMSSSSQAAISAAHDANSVLLQSNQGAQAAYSAYVNALANIDIQPSMDAAAKQAAITTQTQIFNAAIAGLKNATPATPDVSSPLDINPAPTQQTTVGGVDVSDMLNFG